MKKLNLSIIKVIFLFVMIGCTKEEEIIINDACTKEILKELDMVPYTGQTNYCNSLSLYEFNNEKYFIQNCCVCDMLPNPVNCDNVSYVIVDGKYDEEKAKIFFAKAKHKGIVGIFE
ncbi:MAG: hypothetical protein RLZZ546_1721 [Bacteroidota bacterium]|jgi:hypothetical protein